MISRVAWLEHGEVVGIDDPGSGHAVYEDGVGKFERIESPGTRRSMLANGAP